MTSWEFDATGPVRADIDLPAGSVRVTAVKTETVRVNLTASGHAGERLLAETEVSFGDGTLRVHVPKRVSVRGNSGLDLTVELPEGSSVKAMTASADVTFEGELGSVNGSTASGDVRAGRVSGDVELTTASGDVRLEEATGDVRVSTASGDANVGRAGGDIIAKTASGDVWIGEAGQSATAKTASGDVRIDAIASGLADATTVSGDIVIAVVPGVGVYIDISTLTGDVSSDLESDAGAEGEASLTVSCRSVSGDVRIARAGAR
jgi:DUF4097 and DUF4098 domain-containing protein YvlB